MDGEVTISCTCPSRWEHTMYVGRERNPTCTMHGDHPDAVRRRESYQAIVDASEAARKPKVSAGFSTCLVVAAKDGTLRDVAICADDTAETIGLNAIAAINGERLFQRSTVKCCVCGDYADTQRGRS